MTGAAPIEIIRAHLRDSGLLDEQEELSARDDVIADLGGDALDVLEIVIALESAFDFATDQEPTTVGDLIRLVPETERA